MINVTVELTNKFDNNVVEKVINLLGDKVSYNPSGEMILFDDNQNNLIVRNSLNETYGKLIAIDVVNDHLVLSCYFGYDTLHFCPTLEYETELGEYYVFPINEQDIFTIESI